MTAVQQPPSDPISWDAVYNNINPKYLDDSKFTKEEIENANKAADHWYHTVGPNVIPADTRIKKAWILKSWTPYQDNPVPLDVFEKWKALGLFAYGIGVVLGRLRRGVNAGKYLNMVDADNRLAIQEICNRDGKVVSIDELAGWTLVEQHRDNPDKAHIYVISEKPFPIKASDKGRPDMVNRIIINEIPAIEVKNIGGLSFAWNSMHENGYRYEFVNGIENAALCDEFPEQINNVCKKYGLEYLDENGNGKGDIPITELFKPDTIIYDGNNRHKEVLRVADSLINRNKAILPLDEIKQIVMTFNQGHCRPPLDNRELDSLFKQAQDFVAKGERARYDNAIAVETENSTISLDIGESLQQEQITYIICSKW